MIGTTLRRTFREACREVQSLLSSPTNYSACRAIALCCSTGFICSSAPLWIQRAFLINPFLGFSVLLLTCLLLYNLWKKYNSHLKITVFHFGKWLILSSKHICEEYVFFGADTLETEVKMRRARNRKLVRTAVFYLMVQHCIAPTSHLVWVHSLLAYVFLKEVLQWAHTQGVVNNNTDVAPVSLMSRWVPRTGIAMKTFLSAAILYHQFFHVSKFYLLVTATYFMLNQHFLERPVTKVVESFQLDMFEGLEQYYVMGALGCVEILFAFVFMVWTLVQSGQLVMLVALYTNVFTGGREIITSAVNAAFKEWLVIAQFERATSEELRLLDDVCAICLATMKTARKTNCKHFFHGHCLRRCLKEKLTCPMCSKKIL